MDRELALGAVLALAAGASCAQAAMLISPLAVQLSPARRVGEVRITNTGAEPMTIQSAAVRWTQADGADSYADADEILVAPAIATLPPGGAQVFRVAVRKQAASEAERAYRLFLEDVTPPKPGGGAQLRIRNNLPLFIEARKGAGRPILTPCAGSSNRVCVHVENAGERHFTVNRVLVETGGQRREEPAATPVLAGSWRELTYDVNKRGAVKVTVETSAGAVSTVIPGDDG